ncbi:involucrin-like [Etheostoma cragini]|uniref:involucrin-like n=1 Tax=Etheostoma cragini TaxID=417921 RepID=UPI00155ED9C7|nr:involucrin-like [Etheostoma cragini]
MCKVQMLRALVEQRLTAAAEEIFGLFERTIAEYEEELCRSKEENERHRKRLDAVFSPQLRLHRAELPQQLNMPVITSVESEANRDPQLHRAENQDQKGGQHGDSGSTRNAEPGPKKRRRTSRSHSNNVDNTNISEVHPDTQTELRQQHVCEEEVLPDQQLCIQKRTSSLDQEDPEPPQIKEGREKLCTNQEGKEDNFRHSNNVNNTNVPEIHRNTQTDVQQLPVVKDWVPPEQQDWSSSLDQEHPDPPHIKEEQEELWTSQEGEQLQGLEEADIKFQSTSVPVKKEDDEEKAQSLHLHREAERTGADGEDWGGPEPATYYKTLDSPESETDYSADWEESGLNSLQNNEEPTQSSTMISFLRLFIMFFSSDVRQLSVVKAEVPPEQQGWSSSLDQEEPDPPHIKEEQEQLWTSQEGEQLQGLEETDIKFPFTSVPVKSEEDDGEKAQFSQLHREAE